MGRTHNEVKWIISCDYPKCKESEEKPINLILPVGWTQSETVEEIPQGKDKDGKDKDPIFGPVTRYLCPKHRPKYG